MEFLPEQACCFTGHRKIEPNDFSSVMRRTELLIRTLIQDGVNFYLVGGALGYDTEVAKLLFRLRDTEYPEIKVILIYPFEGFTRYWELTQQVEYHRLLSHYDQCLCSSQTPGRAAYLQRDRQLVDNSSYCICYCTRKTGGTAYTVRYAQSQNRTVWNTTDYYDIGLLFS